MDDSPEPATMPYASYCDGPTKVIALHGWPATGTRSMHSSDHSVTRSTPEAFAGYLESWSGGARYGFAASSS
jgi:hypothetical protein